MRKTKKIALASWLGGPNYGTVLQSYALYKTIERLGYDVTVITRHDFVYGMKLKLGLRQQFPGSVTALKSRKMQHEEIKTRDFVTRCGYKSFCRTCDAFVCGSDQMWNTHYNFNPDFFLANAPGRKKIAYAPSIGTIEFEPSTADLVKSYLESFQSLSVREETGRKAVAALTGRDDVRVVLDPVFLRSREDWERFAAESSDGLGTRGCILCYLLRRDVDRTDIIARVKARCGDRRVVVVQSYENPELVIPGAAKIADAGPREFVGMFADADFVVTDSFHGTAFSLIFHKPMLCLRRFDDDDARSQNTRITDLLARLGLEDRMPKDCGSDSGWERDIDWQDVDRRLGSLCDDSLNYLKDALDNV